MHAHACPRIQDTAKGTGKNRQNRPVGRDKSRPLLLKAPAGAVAAERLAARKTDIANTQLRTFERTMEGEAPRSRRCWNPKAATATTR